MTRPRLFFFRRSRARSPSSSRGLLGDLHSPLGRHPFCPCSAALSARLCYGPLSTGFSSISPVAIRITLTALPITSAGRFCPFGPLGIFHKPNLLSRLLVLYPASCRFGEVIACCTGVLVWLPGRK